MFKKCCDNLHQKQLILLGLFQNYQNLSIYAYPKSLEYYRKSLVPGEYHNTWLISLVFSTVINLIQASFNTIIVFQTN